MTVSAHNPGLPPIIELNSVIKEFGSYRAVDELSFTVAKGEIVALLGRTGAGKTTVLNLVMGTLAPDRGRVKVAGCDPFRQFSALKGKLAVSFQTDRLLPWRTAVENAELGLLIQGKPKDQARTIASEWLARVNLAGAENKYTHELSGGMRQRVSLARALAVDPELVLLDESFSQLDHVTSHELRQDFCAVAREYGKTCLLVTHRLDDAIEMADRVIVLGPGGHVKLELSLREVATDETVAERMRSQIAAALGEDNSQAGTKRTGGMTMSTITRRSMMITGAAALGALAAPSVLRAQEAAPIRAATASPGLTVMFYDYIRDNGLDKKNGLELAAPILNSSIGTLYNDFVAGTFDMVIGSWDPFLTRYRAGVPCRLLCSLMTADMIGVVATADGPRSVAELEGKMIVAPQQSGVYRMTRALISEFEGIDIEKVARVQNADNPAQGVTLVIADRADAAVAWEPMISQGIERRSDLGIIFNAGEAFRKHTSQSLPYFCITVRKELLDRSPDMAKRLNAMFAECVKGIDADFDALAEKYASRTMLETKVLKVAKSAGRLRFDYNAASDPDFQKTVTSASEILVRQGILAKPADSGFFAG